VTLVEQIFKYPRTLHIEGSHLQPGDGDLAAVPMLELKGVHLVVEEKIDGANAGIGFYSGGRLQLQSRGHFLAGGHRERHFNLFKTWATSLHDRLWQALGPRYLMYGEWVYAKHTIFYDQLPHYFLEFDILDKSEGVFLSTGARQDVLDGLPICSVPVLKSGSFDRIEDLTALVGPSNYKSRDWLANLKRASEKESLDVERTLAQSDLSDLMEGLYIKAEGEGKVHGRYKYVRRDFLMRVTESDSHWRARPILPNSLAPGTNIFART
jgi:hypothetical protein